MWVLWKGNREKEWGTGLLMLGVWCWGVYEKFSRLAGPTK